jgi:hypothetical protein
MKRTQLLRGQRFSGETLKYYIDNPDGLNALAEALSDNLLRLDALYILAELGTKAKPVWKHVLPHVSDPNVGAAFHALDVVHENADGEDYQEIMNIVPIVDLDNEGLLTKICFIHATYDFGGIENMYKLAISEPIIGAQALGIFILNFGRELSNNTIAKIISTGDRIILMYVCAHIARNPDARRDLLEKLPKKVQEQIRIMYMSQ